MCCLLSSVKFVEVSELELLARLFQTSPAGGTQRSAAQRQAGLMSDDGDDGDDDDDDDDDDWTDSSEGNNETSSRKLRFAL